MEWQAFSAYRLRARFIASSFTAVKGWQWSLDLNLGLRNTFPGVVYIFLSLRHFSYLAMEKSIPLSGKLFAFLVIYEGAKLKPSQLQNAGK